VNTVSLPLPLISKNPQQTTLYKHTDNTPYTKTQHPKNFFKNFEKTSGKKNPPAPKHWGARMVHPSGEANEQLLGANLAEGHITRLAH
jgi:hypothetical protein